MFKTGWDSIVNMLLSIEVNQILLQPQMKDSEAIAKGQQRSSVKPLSSSSHQDGYSSNIEAKYYGSVTSFLLNLILGRSLSSYATFTGMPSSTFQLYPTTSSLYERILAQPIRNYEALAGLSDLLLCGQAPLIFTALRSLRLLLLADNTNVIALDFTGVTETLFLLLAAIIFTDRLPISLLGQDCSSSSFVSFRNCRGLSTKDIPISLSLDDTTSLSTSKWKIDPDVILKEINSTLQTYAVIKSNLNISTMAFYLAVMSHIYYDDQDSNLEKESSSSSQFCRAYHLQEKSSNRRMSSSCQYCDSDIATLECLQCARDGVYDCFRLCSECDRVFHKATAKRHHIRIQVHPAQLTTAIHHESKPLSFETCSAHEIIMKFMDDKTKYALSVANALKSKFSDSIAARRNDAADSCHLKRMISLYVVLRGLLDDRLARKQGLPLAFIEPLAFFLKNLILQPVHDEDMTRGSSNSKDIFLQSAADFRNDTFTDTFDITSCTFDSNDNIAPPETMTLNEERIVIMILLQCLTRLMLYGSICSNISQRHLWIDMPREQGSRTDIARLLNDSSEYAILHARENRTCVDLRECVKIIRDCGIDGILLILFSTEKLEKHRHSGYLNSSDRQFILWMFREIMVMAIDCEDSASSDWLTWWLWLLSSKVYNSSLSSDTNKTTKWSTMVPASSSSMSSQSRLFVLQEFILLLTSKFSSNDLNSKYIDAFFALSQGAFAKIPCTLPIPATPTRNNSYEQLNSLPTTHQAQLSSTAFQQAISSSYGYRPSLSTKKIKQLLSELGATHLLTRIVFGDLCHPTIQKLFQACLSTNDSQKLDDLSLDQISDLHVEEWWASLSAWIAYVSENPDAKSSLRQSSMHDQHLRIILVLARVANAWYPKSSKSRKQRFGINLVQCAIELFVDGTFNRTLPQFSMVSCQWLSHESNGNNIDVSSESRLRGSESLGKHDHLLFRLFRRNSLADMRIPSMASLADQGSAQLYDFCADDVLSVSPIFYIRPRALASIISAYRPSLLILFDFIRDEWTLQSQTMRLSKAADTASALKLSRSSHFNENSMRIYHKGHALATHSLASDASGTTAEPNHPWPTKKRNTSFGGQGTGSMNTHILSADSETWEVESSMTSTAGGDTKGSQHSYQSLAALSNALFHISSSSPPSISGDSTHSYQPYERSRSQQTSSLIRSSSYEDMDSTSHGKLHLHLNDLAIHTPFPPVYINGNEEWKSSTHCSVLSSILPFSTFNHLSFIDLALLLVHNHMLSRFGLTPDLISSDDEYILHRPPAFLDVKYQDIYAAYKLMLKKHFSIFFHQSLKFQKSLTDSLAMISSSNINSDSNYALIVVSKADDARALLETMCKCSGELQEQFIYILSNLIRDSCNGQVFSEHEALIFSLINDAMTTTDIHLEHAYHQLITKILSQRMSTALLEKLIAQAELTAGSDSKPHSPNRVNRRAFSSSNSSGFIIRLLVNIISSPAPPLEYSHDRQQTGTTLPAGYVSNGLRRMSINILPYPESEVSISIWVRPGIGNNTSGSVARVQAASTTNGPRSFDIFFRSLQSQGIPLQGLGKANTGMHSGISTPRSAFSSMQNGMSTSLGETKTYLQLCLSINDDNEMRIPRKSTTSPEKGSHERQHGWSQYFHYIAGIVSTDAQSGQTSADEFKDSFYNELFGSENPDSELSTATSLLASVFSRYLVPDIIIDYEWNEPDSWRLLCLHFRQSQIECFIDGTKRQLLYWTPFGYQYDSEYRQRQDIIDNVLSKDNGEGSTDGPPTILVSEVKANAIDVNSSSFHSLPMELWGCSNLLSKIEDVFADISPTNILSVAVGSLNDREILNLIQEKISKLSTSLRRAVDQVDRHAGDNGDIFDDSLIRAQELSLHLLTWLTNSYLTVTRSFYGDIGSAFIFAGNIDIDRMMYMIHVGPYIDPSDTFTSAESKSMLASSLPSLSSSVAGCPPMKRCIVDLGGFKLFYALLKKHNSNQSLVLRIICEIATKSSPVFVEKYFLSCKVPEVILYCLSESNAYTAECLQVLTESASYLSRLPDQVNFKSERIVWILRSVPILRLLIDLAVYYRNRVDITVRIVEWLSSLCSEQTKNSLFVVENIDLNPLLILLFLWHGVSDAVDLDRNISNSPVNQNNKSLFNMRKSIATDQLPAPTSALSLRLVAERTRKESMKKDRSQDKPTFSAEDSKLQAIVARLLRSLLCTIDSARISDQQIKPVSTWLNLISSCIAFGLFCFRSSIREENENPLHLGESTPNKRRANEEILEQRAAVFLSAANKILAAVAQGCDSIGCYSQDRSFKLSSTFHDQIWFPLLEMLGGLSADLKVSCIKILFWTMSSDDRHFDAKSVAYFEKISGFHVLGENLSTHNFSDVEEKLIGQTMLKLLFLKGNDTKEYSSNESAENLKLSSSSSLFPPIAKLNVADDKRQSSASSLKTAQLSLTSILESSGPSSNNSTLVYRPKEETSSASNALGLLSLFSWTSASSTTLPTKPAASAASRSLINDRDDNYTLTTKVDGFHEESNPVSDGSNLSPMAAPASYDRESTLTGLSSPISHFPEILISQDAESLDKKLFVENESRFRGRPPSVNTCSTTITTADNAIMPQLIIPILRLASTCKSTEANGIIAPIERYLSSLTTATGSPTSQRSVEMMREIVSQYDLLNTIVDCISKVFDRIRQLHLHRDGGGAAATDDSDNHSVNSLIFSDTDTDMSGVESDGDTSSQHSAIFPQQYVNQVSSSSREEAKLLQLVGIFVKLLRVIFVQDILLQPLPNRLWKELFQSTNPTSGEVLLLICYDFINSIRHLFSMSSDVVLVVIDDAAQLLLQALERVDIPIDFSVKALHAIHLLYYQCPPDVRRRLNSNSLQQIRHDFLLRVVFDRQEEISVRATAINDVKSSLQAYFAAPSSTVTSTSKPVQDSTLLLSILSMFLEAYEEIDAIANEVHQSAKVMQPGPSSTFSSSPPSNASSLPGSYPSSPSGFGKQLLMDPAQVVEKIQLLLDVMQHLIIAVQLCVRFSADNKRIMSKLASDIPGDVDKLIFKTFTGVPITQSASDQMPVPMKADLHDEMPVTISNSLAQMHSRSPRMQSPSMWGSLAISSSSRSLTSSPTQLTDSVAINISEEGGNPNASSDASSQMSLHAFLDWYLAIENKALHAALRARILKEHKSTVKLVEKFWDRLTQKKTKFQRQWQDRQTRDLIRLQKLLRENSEKSKAINDARATASQKELDAWYENLHERVRVGREVFESSVIQEPSP
jgi:hypothetical protein